MCFNLRQCYQVMKNHSNIPKMHYWMIQRAKNVVFGPFLDLGLLDRLDIINYDKTSCFLTSGNTSKSWMIIQKSPESIFEKAFKESKKSEKVSEVEPVWYRRYSSQRQLRLGLVLSVRWLVLWSICCFSGKPRTGFFRNLAWTFSTIRLRNAHGRLSGKNLDHSIISDVRPKTAIFQLWADFDGKPR